jgi:hypothetical protein
MRTVTAVLAGAALVAGATAADIQVYTGLDAMCKQPTTAVNPTDYTYDGNCNTVGPEGSEVYYKATEADGKVTYQKYTAAGCAVADGEAVEWTCNSCVEVPGSGTDSATYTAYTCAALQQAMPTSDVTGEVTVTANNKTNCATDGTKKGAVVWTYNTCMETPATVYGAVNFGWMKVVSEAVTAEGETTYTNTQGFYMTEAACKATTDNKALDKQTLAACEEIANPADGVVSAAFAWNATASPSPAPPAQDSAAGLTVSAVLAGAVSAAAMMLM